MKTSKGKRHITEVISLEKRDILRAFKIDLGEEIDLIEDASTGYRQSQMDYNIVINIRLNLAFRSKVVIGRQNKTSYTGLRSNFYSSRIRKKIGIVFHQELTLVVGGDSVSARSRALVNAFHTSLQARAEVNKKIRSEWYYLRP
jgi:hypothetical protein